MRNVKHNIAVFISDTNPGGTEAYLRSYIPHINRDLFNVYVVATGPELLADEIGKLGDKYFNIKTGSFPRMQKLVVGKLTRDYIGIFLLPIWFFHSVFKLLLLVRRERIDLIHSHGIHFNMVAALACKIANIPSVCHVHAPPKLRGRFSEFGASGYLLAFLADNLISVSEFAASQFHKSWRRKTTVIPNSVDYNYIKDNLKHNDLREMANFSQSDFVVGNVAVVQDRKGLDRFFLLAEKFQDVPQCKFLLIAGVYDDVSRCLLETLKKKFVALHNILIIENLKEAMLYLCDLDVFFMCSRPGTETFGLVVVEAMAAGTPVIAFENDAMPEIIIDGVNGYLVPEDMVDKVAGIISEMILRKVDMVCLKLAAENSVHDYFDVKIMCRKIENLYCKVLGI